MFNKDNEEDKKRLYNLYVIQNKTLSAISKEINCSPSQVHRYIAFFGFTRKPAETIPSDAELRDLFLSQNKTCVEIAQMFGVPKSSLSKRIARLGLQKSSEQLADVKQRTTVRREATNIEKYGTKNPMQNADVVAKGRATNFQKYGCANVFQNPSIIAKSKDTCLKKYGVEKYSSTSEFSELMRDITVFTRSGFKEKAMTTNLSKYGTEYPSQNEEIKAKTRATNLARYGVEYPSTLPYIQEKIKQTNIDRYGRDVTTRRIWTDEQYQVLTDKNNFIAYISSNNLKTPITISEHIGVSLSTIDKVIGKFGLWGMMDVVESNPELHIGDFLDSLDIKHEKTRDIIAPYELDFYCPSYNIAIEFNGNYWHREDYVGKNYHLRKSLLAREKNVFLYHIFEYEWKDLSKREKIKNQLINLFGKNTERIYARKCIIKEVDIAEKNEFLDANHLQGADKSSARLGLYYQDRLVAIMTFCKPRFNKNYRWELSRFCCASGSNIVGGASKLFKYFTDNILNPGESIITYSDVSKTRGNLYLELGFHERTQSPPNYVWIKGSKVKTRYQTQMKNERQNMSDQGYFRVFDCGNRVWEYNK